MTRITHQYRYQQPGDKRWKKTRHHMDADFASEWFAKFHPGAVYEPIAYTAVELKDPTEIGPNNHGGWRPSEN